MCLLICFQATCFTIKAQQIAELSFREQLFEERNPQKHKQLLKQASENKTPTQVIFEARFLFSIDQPNDSKLLDLLNEDVFNMLEKNFEPGESEIFTSLEELQATFYYIRAVDAFAKKNNADFEKFVKQAFWLSPSQASLLTTYIYKFQTRNLIQNYTHPSKLELTSQDAAANINWNILTKGTSGTVLIIYSPWDQQSINTVAAIEKVSKHPALSKHKLILHNIETNLDALEANRSYRALFNDTFNATWTIENKKTSLLNLFKIKTLPTCITFNTENKINYIGKVDRLLEQL